MSLFLNKIHRSRAVSYQLCETILCFVIPHMSEQLSAKSVRLDSETRIEMRNLVALLFLDSLRVVDLLEFIPYHDTGQE